MIQEELPDVQQALYRRTHPRGRRVVTSTRRDRPEAGLWPQLEDLVPPELPPDIAIARLVALARSLLIENRQLREAVAASIERSVPARSLGGRVEAA